MPAMSSEARAIALLALAAFVSASAFRICDPMLPQLAAEFGTTTGQAARAVTAFAVAYGVLQMFFGPVGDRYGKYRVVSVATVGCALGSAGAVMAGSLDMLVFCRALSGAAGAGIVPLSMAWIGDNVPYERRQATLARFLTGTILGMSAGQLAGGLFADTVGWRWAFAALVAGYLVVGVLLHLEVRRQRAAGFAQVDPNAVRQGFVAQARLVLGAPWARVVLATVFIEGLLVFGALAFAPSYLHERFDISLTAAGALVAVYAVGGLIYTVVAGRILKRLGERGLAVAGGLVLGVAFLSYLLGPVWMWSLLASVLAGFGYYLLHATLQTNATQMVPSARGTAVAWFASCLFMGQAAGVALAGAVVDEIGPAALFGGSAVLLPLLGAFFARALKARAAIQQG
ncbi:MFS transporter [Achromobacter arsenitoxydans]|uniref:Major facilitator protein n=1 Tax=Achromobacter arsenitoxydans SY8 TaxID=477184 RepID=H0F7L9_9BURK|nr:MFS transporter [Achromobacter arsenitoxydans]EHK65760.1 major facilitator protein [Achromobacter arsenitoxydans SY8]